MNPPNALQSVADPEYAARLIRFNGSKHYRKCLTFGKTIVDHRLSMAMGLPVRVLDYGCGNGTFCRSVLSSFPQVQMFGADVRTDLLHYAGSFGHRITYETPDTALSRKYDVINCSSVLGHIEDPQDMLRRFYEALNPAGYLAVTIPSRLYEWAMWPKNRITGYRSDPTLKHRWFQRQLIADLKEAGFEVMHVYPLSRVGLFHESHGFLCRKGDLLP